MFERFTSRARRVVVHAQEEARDLNHDYIGTEHVLLGLAREDEGLAAQALHRLGVSHRRVRELVIEIAGQGGQPPTGHIPFTRHAKKALELALREALRLRHSYIGTEHILLGLVREGEGRGARVLVQLGAGQDQVRREVTGLLTETPGEDAPESAAAPGRHAHTPAAAEVLATAEALAGGSPVGSHHLLEALARSDRSAAFHALTAVGVDTEVLTAKLDELGLEGTTDLTPEEEAARQMEITLTDDEVHVVLRDEATIARVRTVTERLAGPVRGTDPVAGGLVSVHQAVQRYLDRLRRRLEPAAEQTVEAELGQGVTWVVRQAMGSRLRRRTR